MWTSNDKPLDPGCRQSQIFSNQRCLGRTLLGLVCTSVAPIDGTRYPGCKVPDIRARDRLDDFEGNSPVLDHAFVIAELAERARVDIVHLNVDHPPTDGATVASDHEPLVMRLRLSHR